MCRNSFVLYIDQKEVIDQLSNDDAGKLLKAIYQYNYNGEVIIDGMLKAIFTQFKIFLDKDNTKWEEQKKKRSEAGKKGMASRWNNNVIDNYNKDNSVIDSYNKLYQDITNITDNVNVNDNVNDNVNVNVNNTINIYDYVEQNFGRTLNGIEIEMIKEWKDNDLTRYAIKQAVLNGKYNIKYINTILSNYKNNSITTVQQAQEEEKKFKNRKNNKVENPKWFDKKIEKEEDNGELEKILKEWK